MSFRTIHTTETRTLARKIQYLQNRRIVIKQQLRVLNREIPKLKLKKKVLMHGS